MQSSTHACPQGMSYTLLVLSPLCSVINFLLACLVTVCVLTCVLGITGCVLGAEVQAL